MAKKRPEPIDYVDAKAHHKMVRETEDENLEKEFVARRAINAQLLALNERRSKLDTWEIRVLEREGTEGVFGTLRYILLHDNTTAPERYQAAREICYLAADLRNSLHVELELNRKAWLECIKLEELALTVMERYFGAARTQTDKDYAKWHEEQDKL